MGQGGSTTHHYYPPSDAYVKTGTKNNDNYTVSYNNNYSNNKHEYSHKKMENCLLGEYTSMCAAPLVGDGKNNTISFIACCKPHSMIIESYNNKEDALEKARYYKDINFNASFHAYKACLDMCSNNNNNEIVKTKKNLISSKVKSSSCLIELQTKAKDASNSWYCSNENNEYTKGKNVIKSSNMIIMDNKNGEPIHKLFSSPALVSDSVSNVNIPVLCLDIEEKESNASTELNTNSNNNAGKPTHDSSCASSINILDKQYSGSSSTAVYSNKSSRLHSGDSLTLTTARNELLRENSGNYLFSFPTSTSISYANNCIPSPPPSPSINSNDNVASKKLKNLQTTVFEEEAVNKQLLPPFNSISSACNQASLSPKFNNNSNNSDIFVASVCDEIAQLCFSNCYAEEALLWYNKAISLDGTNSMYFYRKGVVLQSLGYVSQAIASFNEALKFDENCKPAIFNLGVVKITQNPEEALKLFTQILLLEPDNTEVMSLMAECHEIQGRITEAIAYLNRVIELDTNNFAVKRTLQKMHTKLNITTR